MLAPTAQELDELIATTGEALDAVEVRAFGEELWGIAFDNTPLLTIELDGERRCLVLSSPIGLPPAGHEAQVYKLLLQLALAWRDTRGLHMGIDSGDDSVVQLQELSIGELEPAGFASALGEFIDRARAAMATLAAFGQTEALARPSGDIGRLVRA